MKKFTIVLTSPIRKHVIDRVLRPRAHVIVAPHRAALIRALPKADALITLLTDPINDALLKNAPHLKVIGNYAVGYNNIDVQACARRGIRIVNTPHVLTRATAELTLGLLIAAARRFPEGESMCRKNAFAGWAPDLLLGLELKGRTAVLVGAGQIGRETAKLFRAIGLKVEWITRTTSKSDIRKKLKKAQVLSFHCPLTPATHHWLGRERISLLPRDCIVLNTSRGPVIDENALAHALSTQRIFAAGLDVYEQEPLIPAGLRQLSNVVLLPHLGSATEKTRDEMAELVCSGVLAILAGKRAHNEVKS